MRHDSRGLTSEMNENSSSFQYWRRYGVHIYMRKGKKHNTTRQNCIISQFDVLHRTDLVWEILTCFKSTIYSSRILQSFLALPGLTSTCAVRPAASGGRSLALRPRPVGWTSMGSETRIKTPLKQRKTKEWAVLWSDCDSFVLWGANATEQRGCPKSVSPCVRKLSGKERKNEGMRLERQVTVSLVFRRDPVGVMRMTLPGGDI